MYKKKPNRASQTITLKDGIDSFLNAYKLKPRFSETMAVSIWESLMGQSIAKRTISINVRKGTLFVKLDSAPLKQELNNSKSRIVNLINEEVGVDAIKEIVFL